MGTYEHWPYSNLHDLNLDWVLQIIGDFKRQYENLTEYFNGLIDQLDEKTQEEIAEFDEAISGFETTLRQLAIQLQNDTTAVISEARTAAVNNIYDVEHQSMQNVANIANGVISDVRAAGADVLESIPSDYTQLDYQAIQVIGAGIAPDAITNLNDPYFFSNNNRIINCDPNMSLSNAPVQFTAGEYVCNVLTIRYLDQPAGSGWRQTSNQWLMMRKVSDGTVHIYVRTAYIDTNADYQFQSWVTVI